MEKIKIGVVSVLWLIYFYFLKFVKPVEQGIITKNKLSNTAESYTEKIGFDVSYTFVFWILLGFSFIVVGKLMYDKIGGVNEEK